MAVWDCFCFNNELDLLAVRLAELAPVVDHFVIVEAPLTHSGHPKRLWFAEHRDRFAVFADRIVHVVATLPESGPWDRELAQHAAMRQALEDAAPNDLVLVSDLDEVPYREIVAALDGALERPTRVGMRHATYYANWMLPTPWCEGTFAFRAAQRDDPMARVLLGEAHDEWEGYREPLVPDGGWHLSYLVTAPGVSEKFGAASDQQYDNDRDRAPAHLERCLQYKVHFQGRHLLRRLPREQFDPLLERLLAGRPDLFDFGPAPSAWRARAYCTYTWLRRMPRFPRSLVRWLDDHEWAVIGPGAPVLVALGAFLDARRRRRQRPTWAGTEVVHLDSARAGAPPRPA
jgi:hypothetical protein